MNRASASWSSPDETRLSELAAILAAGLMRLKARQSSRKSPESRESSLDFVAHRSGHGQNRPVSEKAHVR